MQHAAWDGESLLDEKKEWQSVCIKFRSSTEFQKWFAKIIGFIFTKWSLQLSTFKSRGQEICNQPSGGKYPFRHYLLRSHRRTLKLLFIAWTGFCVCCTKSLHVFLFFVCLVLDQVQISKLCLEYKWKRFAGNLNTAHMLFFGCNHKSVSINVANVSNKTKVFVVCYPNWPLCQCFVSCVNMFECVDFVRTQWQSVCSETYDRQQLLIRLTNISS